MKKTVVYAVANDSLFSFCVRCACDMVDAKVVNVKNKLTYFDTYCCQQSHDKLKKISGVTVIASKIGRSA